MDERRIFHLKNLLSQSVGRSWCVKSMAAEIGLSVPHLHQLFKKHVGMTPLVYLHTLRLERAAELLSDTRNFSSVKEIAYSVGYSDDSHFIRDFKKKYSNTPTEYRHRYSEIEQLKMQFGHE